LNDSVIETLARLQAIDRRNRERGLEIEEIERRSAELANELQTKRTHLDTARADAESLGVRRRELEALVQEEERRLKERRMRLTRIRNDREQEAARREIDGLKELTSHHEEELLTLMEQTEAADGGVRALDAEFQTLDEQSRSHQAASAGRADQLRGEIEADRGEREQVAGLLGDSIRRRYEQIFARRGGLAVVEMRKDICLGCHMSVPPQLANEIRKGQSVHTCPSCHRILFWRVDSDEAATKEAKQA